LAGFQVQYSTFGYYICGVLGLLAGDKVLTAYNLMIAWTFATYAGSLWLLFRSLGFGKWGACLGTAVIALGSHVLCFAEAAQHLFSGGAYDWWAVSRVISHTITEFPIWTASLGDLHPHYLAMPFFILFLSHTFIQLFGKEEVDRRRAWIYVLSAAPLAAWIWGANTWDLPVVLIIGGGAIGLRARKLGPATLAKLGAAMLAMTTLLALPFLGSAPKAPKEFGWVHVRSSIVELWLFFGFFFAPILWGIYRRLRRQVPNDWFWGGGLVFVLSVIFQSATLFILTALYFLFQAWYRETPDRQGLPVFLATAGFGILLGCEIVHLQDIFGDTMERLNTVFKFYIPAWALLGISAFLFMAEIIPAIPRPWSRLLAVVWAIALSGHLVAGLSARNNGFAGPDRLAGMDFWLRTAPDDARVMDWTRQQVVAHQLKGVVLEAGGGAFTSFARFSSVSGLLGYEGWQVYGGMLQTFGNIRELGYRADKVKFFYSAGLPNCDALLSDLKKEKIDYVLVGMLERQIYPIAGLDLLRHCLHPVYEAGRTSLLAVAAPGV
jgi:YYY domain-containing protein